MSPKTGTATFSEIQIVVSEFHGFALTQKHFVTGAKCELPATKPGQNYWEDGCSAKTASHFSDQISFQVLLDLVLFR